MAVLISIVYKFLKLNTSCPVNTVFPDYEEDDGSFLNTTLHETQSLYKKSLIYSTCFHHSCKKNVIFSYILSHSSHSLLLF